MYAIDAADGFLVFDSATPGTITNHGDIGLPAGEIVKGMDSRPATGEVIVLSRDAGGVGRLYSVNTVNGDIGSPVTLAADPTDATNPYTTLVSANAYGIDFNPVSDRLRVVTADEQSYRINVDTGLVTTDADLAPAGGYTPSGLAVAAVAYSNNFPGASTTLLYGYNFTPDDVVTINPPNDGTLNFFGEPGIVALQSGRLNFDVAPNGTAYLTAFTGATNTDRLFTMNLTTGAVTPVVTIGAGAQDIRGLTASTQNLIGISSPSFTAAESGGTYTFSVTRATPRDRRCWTWTPRTAAPRPARTTRRWTPRSSSTRTRS